MNSTGSTRTGLFKSRVLRLQAGIAALIGAFVLIGWHIGYTPLIQWAPGLTPMAYTTALSFVILGVAMLLMSWERERAVTLLASSVAGLSLLTLTEYAAGNSIGIDRILPRLDAVPDVIRMAPNTAVCLLLISVGLVTRKRPQSRAAGSMIAILAAVAMGISAVSLVGYLTGYATFAWGPFIPMAPHTSVGLTLLAGCIVCAAWQRDTSRQSVIPSWLYLAVTVLSLVVTISLSQALAASEHNNIENTVETELKSLTTAVSAQMQHRIARLTELAYRWEPKGAPTEADWRFESRLLTAELRGFACISWTDPSFQVRWTDPPHPDCRKAMEPAANSLMREAMAFARNHRRPAMSHRMQLPNGAFAVDVYIPIERADELQGFIGARFLVRDLFEAMLGDTAMPGYMIVVRDGADELFARSATASDARRSWTREAGIELGNVRWTVTVWPTRSLMVLMQSTLQEVLLGAGPVLSILLGIAVFLAQLAWREARMSETARRELEKEAAERRRVENELEQFFTVSPDLLCIAGFDGYFKRLNPSWGNELGYSIEHLLERPLLEFVCAEDQEPTKAAIRGQKGGETIISFENRYCRADGTYRWLRWSSRPDEQRRLIFAAARDVTAEKAAEQQLRSARDELELKVRERTTELERANQTLKEREMLFRKLFEDSPIGAFLLGLDQRFTHVNSRLLQWLGFTSGELVDLTPGAIALTDDRQALEKSLQQIIAGEIPTARHTGRYRPKGGGIVWGDLTAVLIRDDTGKSIAVLGMVENITDRIQREHEISRLNRELENHIGELTVMNQELESFNYSVSHDLRAPLRHIDGFSKVLLEDYGADCGDGARRLMGRIRDGARRMGRMIDELLELSRTARREISRQLTGLKPLVLDVIDELKLESGDRKIVWSVGELPFADCDPMLIRQVFANLLSNAVKFSRMRECAVIEVNQKTMDGEAVYFVRDNGVGFSMKYAGKLFGVFERLHRREDFEGTGIGLATVQRIIHKHGGRIWADAELEKGATFYFTLGTERESKTTPAEPELAAVGAKQC